MRLHRMALVPALAVLIAGGVGCDEEEQTDESFAVFALDESEPLEVDETLTPSLDSDHAVDPVTGGGYRAFEIELSEGDILRVTSDGTFKPHLTLYDPDRELIGATELRTSLETMDELEEADEDELEDMGIPEAVLEEHDMAETMGGSDVDYTEPAQVVGVAEEDGEYLLIVSSYHYDDDGDFTLDTRLVEDAPDTLEFPHQEYGYLYLGKPRHPDTESPYDSYDFEVDDTTVIEAEMSSLDFPVYLALLDEDDEIIESDFGDPDHDAEIMTSVPAGDYEFIASTADPGFLGRYRLEVETLDVPSAEDFVLGETFEGQLGVDFEQIPGRFSRRMGEPLSFEVDEPTQVEFTMTSDDVDPYLVLTDEDDEQLASESAGWRSEEAVIDMPLNDPGEYTIWPSSRDGHAEGEFVLESSVGDIPDRDPDSIEMGDEIIAELTSDRPRYHPDPNRGYVDYYEFELDQFQEIQADMMSDDIDSYLFLLDENWGEITHNDDVEPGNLDSQIVHPLPPGTYYLAATTFGSSETGEYTVRLGEPGAFEDDDDDGDEIDLEDFAVD